MRRLATGALLGVLAVIGAARFVDFVRNTSLETGFLISGSVTLRYALLCFGLLLCAIPLFFKRKQISPSAFSGASLWFVGALGLMCEVVGLFFALQAILGEFSIFKLCQGILFVFLGLWSFYACVYAMRVKEAVRKGAFIAAVGGGALYLTLLERFLVSPSSLYRMWPVLDVLSLVFALLLYATIYKAVYTKNESRPYRRLTVFGMATFFLSTCMQAPCAVYLFSKKLLHINDLAICILLAVFGIIGAVAAQQAVSE